jgi:cytochrome c biogenesis protein CcdA
MKKKLLLIAVLALLLPQFSFAAEASEAVIYYNEACAMCDVYLENELIPLLNDLGIEEIIVKDYVNERTNRAELNELNEELGIPLVLQGHFTTVIDKKIILQGHVPDHLIRELLVAENRQKFDKIIIFQDEMDSPTIYKAWAFKGEVKEYPLDESIAPYLEWFSQNKESLETPVELSGKKLGADFLLPLIVVTGFLDGINPCAFGVLLFFIAFLYTVKRTKGHILKIGIAYILMIYLAYILIGLGLMQAIAISGIPHLIGKIGAIAIAILALVNIKDYFWYGKGFSLRIPSPTKKYIVNWTHKATLPAAIVLGFLVGLCTFPCSGGIYVAIISLLMVQTTYLEGMSYLLLYNFFFVLPLIIILGFASSKRAVLQMEKLDVKHKKKMKLISGIVMLALAVILWFFTL